MMDDRLGALKRMYDDMEQYAGDKAADMSEPLQKFRGVVPVAQESVTVLAKPPPGAKMSPEQVRKKAADMGLAGLTKGGFDDLLSGTTKEDIEAALAPETDEEEAAAKLARMRAGR